MTTHDAAQQRTGYNQRVSRLIRGEGQKEATMLKEMFGNCTPCKAAGLGVCVCVIGDEIARSMVETGEPRDNNLYVTAPSAYHLPDGHDREPKCPPADSMATSRPTSTATFTGGTVYSSNVPNIVVPPMPNPVWTSSAGWILDWTRPPMA